MSVQSLFSIAAGVSQLSSEQPKHQVMQEAFTFPFSWSFDLVVAMVEKSLEGCKIKGVKDHR